MKFFKFYKNTKIYFTVNFISFLLFSFFAFKQNLLYLFYGEDGHYMLDLISQDFLWRGTELGLSNNFLQSIGGIWFPINTLFIPGYIITFLSTKIFVKKILAYLVFSGEFFLIGLTTARILGLNWNLAILSAWLLPLISFPYHGNPMLYAIMTLVPQLGTNISVAILIIAAFLYLGISSILNSLVISFFIYAMVIYIILAMPASLILAMPSISVICLTKLFLTQSAFEKKIKIISSINIILMLLITGVGSFYYGILKYTAANYLGNDLINDRMSWDNVSILFQPKAGTLLYILAVCGIVKTLLSANSQNKSIALATLFTMLLIIGSGWLTVSFDFWHGPAPLYFEFFLWPFFVAYAIIFLQTIYHFFTKKIKNINLIAKGSILPFIYKSSLLLFPWLILLLPRPVVPEQVYPEHPVITPIVKTLIHDISIRPGKDFNGRVVNLTGRKFDKAVSWPDLENNSYITHQNLGNEHRMHGFWFYNIPTLDVYTPLISPIYFEFAKFFFAFSMDKQVRNIMTLRKPNLTWLQALGVRYIVTDTSLNDAKVKQKILDGNGELLLYELPLVNIGQYSPNIIFYSKSIKETLETLNAKTFDPQNQIVLEEKLPNKLSKAKNGKITVEKGYLRIKASSPGFSLLLLPLEYSHCLKFNNFSRFKPKLIRANLTETAIYFYQDLNIKLRYFTGPFSNSSCRLEDAKDFEKIYS